MNAAFKNWTATLQPLWQQRSPRERLLLSAGAAVMGLALVWRVGLAPALHTWQEAPAKQALLDQQTQQMLQLQAQAQRLKTAQALTRSEAMQWLENHLAELDPKAKLNPQADLVHISLQAAPADNLANWLTQVREQAHARPVQAQLQQATATADEHAVLWAGSLVLRLP
ncbi:MAG: type II secretion system protein GspM [Limnohabitans sp.]